MDDKVLSESILKEWLNVTSTIQNSRIVNGMTYNEALVCNNLWYQSDKEPPYLSSARLCELTGISKSLMNRIVSSLLKKGLVEYAEGIKDKRMKPLKLVKGKINEFLTVHEYSRGFVDELVKIWGRESSEQILSSLQKIHEGFDTLMENRERQEK